MSYHWDLLIDRTRQARAFGGENDQIQWRPKRGDVEIAQRRAIVVKLLQKSTAGAHLFTSDTPVQKGEQSALIRRRNGDEPIDLPTTFQKLNIITTNQPAHAEANDIEPLVGRKIGLEHNRAIAAITLPG